MCIELCDCACIAASVCIFTFVSDRHVTLQIRRMQGNKVPVSPDVNMQGVGASTGFAAPVSSAV